MENYIGSICPLCNREITASDSVKECPDCGIAHHENCWFENRGCTTFGCSMQNSVTQPAAAVTAPAAAAPVPVTICTNCGSPMNEGQAFCSKCGTAKAAAPKKSFCSKCGNELQAGQEFCPMCGQRAGTPTEVNVNPAINQFNAGIEQAKEAKKKKPKKWLLGIVIAIALILAVNLISPALFASVEDLCAQGKYEEAYEKAEAGDKLEIKAENAAAVQSAFSADNLKDPSSFVLRDAYYKEGTNTDGKPNKQLVLYISGANSYGATVSSYWLYTWDNDKNNWKYFCSVSSLTEEEYNSYDDDEERTEKLINNLGRISIKSTMEKGIKLSKDAIKRINNMFKEDILDEVELLRVD